LNLRAALADNLDKESAMNAAKSTFLATPESAERLGSPSTRFLARQPVFDARRTIVGYELLFRSSWENSFRGEVDRATRLMLDNLLIMDIESLANNGLAFVKCSREALVSMLVTLLPTATSIIEIADNITRDPEVMEACHALRRLGYALALDDFAPGSEMDPLLEIASFVKVDFRCSDVATRRRLDNVMKGKRAALLAKKVETQQEFNIALAEGFEYFQGHFFCRPTVMSNRDIPPNRLNYLRLLVELAHIPFDVGRVERVVLSETSLCYRLLRLANSALMGLRGNVTSVRSAIMLVGDDQFRALAAVAISSSLGRDQPQVLVNLSLERARFCELVAPLVGQSPNEQYMIGLLSLVDAILQTPMDLILKSLPLRDEVKEALMGGENGAAIPLSLISSVESGAWDSCAIVMKSHGVSEEAIANLYKESVKWAANALAFCE
jgi:c-di-GMP-related signal transduction protein